MRAISKGHDLRGPLNGLKQYTSNYSSNFRGYRQADAREFLNALLNAFHEELMTSYSRSPINELFTITIQSQMVCQKCLYSENSTDSMKVLPLRPNIQERSRTTLDDLLNTFKKRRDLNVQLQCVKCHRSTQHYEKRIIGDPLPRIIIVYLTRFNSTRTKDDTAVQFPLVHNFGDVTSASYELIGVVTHMGDIYGGHYTAYTKHSQDGWYHFDDAIVQRIGRLDLTRLERDAYMLMYAKKY